ncbi:HlyD family type I secretion periplasmic adaptor subunit [Bradyrhizobium liaoningense]|uniref:HlyD family type I secretion periplasmic adaptor subunit n=1 Tax=Bradyrhizobium liaoningense TaxID=43992 RepID=UPI001BAE370E|nr:HlyD family type I secretion periplasmic adaptor subunit [Bradyrhizobium liaoningense]MBR0904583.1 HlyD family type I secretion periplasmic adaptor subunit [Bradyrhizobium liaoningense]
MNALVKFPVQRKPGLPATIKRGGKQLDHLEFLPANLEILETPASPNASIMLWILCGLLATFLIWSWFAHLDIHAVARGRIQPSGRSKVIQPLEPSKVLSFNLKNGDYVKTGQTLINLDPTDAVADRVNLTSQREWLEAEISRRTTAVQAVRGGEYDVIVQFPSLVSEPIAQQQRAAMLADIGQYKASKDSLDAQRDEQDARRLRLMGSVNAREQLIASLRERVEMRQRLVALDSGTRASVIDALQSLQDQETNLAYDRGQIGEAAAAKVSAEKKVAQLTEEFVAKQTQALVDAKSKLSDVKERLVKASAREDRTVMKSPIDGTVQQLVVTTVGQVLTAGQAVMVIVPNGAALEVEALVENQDIAFVKPGQEVTLKVDAFPFTRYGTINGIVQRVSSDAVDQREAGLTADVSASQKSSSSTSSVSPVQNLVYPVTIQLLDSSINVDGHAVPLGPGMTLTAEVRTGNRRVIDYLLAPLREISSQAARER